MEILAGNDSFPYNQPDNQPIEKKRRLLLIEKGISLK
jgi:hypothetical protein